MALRPRCTLSLVRLFDGPWADKRGGASHNAPLDLVASKLMHNHHGSGETVDVVTHELRRAAHGTIAYHHAYSAHAAATASELQVGELRPSWTRRFQTRGNFSSCAFPAVRRERLLHFCIARPGVVNSPHVVVRDYFPNLRYIATWLSRRGQSLPQAGGFWGKPKSPVYATVRPAMRWHWKGEAFECLITHTAADNGRMEQKASGNRPTTPKDSTRVSRTGIGVGGC